MTLHIRVRFAPSPTGPLHIGGVRTALFNYLFAKKNNGKFILRIEDTDKNRCVDGAENYIIETLKWLNINPDVGPQNPDDFGPYKQSERLAIYPKYIKKLLNLKKAYYAFDTPEDLERYREIGKKNGRIFSYNTAVRFKLKNTLNPNFKDAKSLIKKNYPYVIRFKNPEDIFINTTDLIRGNISVNTDNLDDKILLKSDNYPSYHLANVVDDYLMKITHVIRGEEWLPSLPIHQLLYNALGWENIMPKFAHLPLILKTNGKGKLSKRDGEKGGFPVFPLNWKYPDTGIIFKGFRESGYYPEALVNMLAFLGWNPTTDKEIFSLEELINAFDIKNVNHSGAHFNIEKVKWYNHKYLLKKSTILLAKELEQVLLKKGFQFDLKYLNRVCGLMKERVNFVNEIYDLGSYFFHSPKKFDTSAIKKNITSYTASYLNTIVANIKDIKAFETSILEEKIKLWISENNYNFGKILKPLRLAIVGNLSGVSIFDILATIGKNESLKRIEYFIKFIRKYGN